MFDEVQALVIEEEIIRENRENRENNKGKKIAEATGAIQDIDRGGQDVTDTKKMKITRRIREVNHTYNMALINKFFIFFFSF